MTVYPNFEVIVIDDGSTDRTFAIVNSYKNVTSLQKNNSGSAAAKNFGAKLAKGEYYYFLDSDVIIFEDTITKLVETALEYSSDMVIGRYSTTPMNNGIIHHYKAVADYVLYIPRKNKLKVLIDGQFSSGGEMYSSKAFNRLGGFNEKYPGASVEREELLIRFYNAGFHSAANPVIRTRHYFPDLKTLIKSYIFRIYGTIELIHGIKSPFTYISVTKSIIAPSFSTLSVITCFLSFFNFVSIIFPILCAALFIIFSWEFVYESLKRKNITLAFGIIIVHFFMTAIIFISGITSVLIVKLKNLLKDEITEGN